jgi:hypothetical protein
VDPIEPDHENDDRDDNGENPVERREEKSDVRG